MTFVRSTVLRAGVLAAALVATGVRGAPAKDLSPLPAKLAVSSHSPYEMGACDTCHARRDPDDPGPATATNETCFACHDDFKGTAAVKMDKAVHPAVKGASCVGCHSPHNAKKKKLLL